METFLDLSRYAVPIGVVGAIIFIIGFLLKRGNQEGKGGTNVAATFLMTIGAIGLLFAAAQWITQSFTDWSAFSEKMR